MTEYNLTEEIHETLETGGKQLGKVPFVEELEEKYKGDGYSIRVNLKAEENFEGEPYCKIIVNDGETGEIYSEMDSVKLDDYQETPISETLRSIDDMATEAEKALKKMPKPR